MSADTVPIQEAEDFISGEEVRRKLRVTKATLWVWKSKKGLPSYRGNRFRWSEVETWLRQTGRSDE